MRLPTSRTLLVVSSLLAGLAAQGCSDPAAEPTVRVEKPLQPGKKRRVGGIDKMEKAILEHQAKETAKAGNP